MNQFWICLLLVSLAYKSTGQRDDSSFPDYWDEDYDAQWYNDDPERHNNKEIVENYPKQNEAQANAVEDSNNYNDYDNIINQANLAEQEKYERIMDEKVEEEIKSFRNVNDASVEKNSFGAQPNAVEDSNNFNDYDNIINQANLGEQEKNERIMDEQVEDEIKSFRSANDASVEKNAFDIISDYQFEDNRSLPKDEQSILQVLPISSNEVALKDENLNDKYFEPLLDSNEQVEKHNVVHKTNNSEEVTLNLTEKVKNNKDDLLMSLEDIKIFTDEKSMTNDNENKSLDLNNEPDQVNDNDDSIQSIMQETRKLLEETNEDFDEDNIDDKNSVSTVKQVLYIENKPVNLDGDTVNNIDPDLNNDLNDLFNVLNKLKNEDINNGVIDSSELYYNKNDEYFQKSNEDYVNSFEEDVAESKEQVVDIEDLFKDELNKEVQKLSKVTLKSKESISDNDQSKENIEQPIAYGNDALVASEENNKTYSTENPKDIESKKIDVDALSSSELDNLMKQFEIVHNDDLNTDSKDFDKNIATVYMRLSINETVVITSPNYPNPYPTNNIIDWVFEGDGEGIEFNITDLAVNGALGDYLLVKPGGLDASGSQGLVFSYRLDNGRRYRFMDVNRMFVRFEAKPGMMFFRGFNFTARMILPTSTSDNPEYPKPEQIVQPPKGRHTVYLDGVPLRQFNIIREEFRTVIAEMAEKYIIENNIDYGMNSTLEITQITQATICSVSWPDYTNCLEVTFGVPLSYDNNKAPRLNATELEDMWRTYINQDPFALRLRRMGISEFSPPDDIAILMVWLVIGFGVLISFIMLIAALWRFNCFEDYSRMPLYSDTDSVMEKQGLDLYPTPHQTLPSLDVDSEHEFDTTTTPRADMRGFNNNGYVREDSYLSSEKAMSPPIISRERYTEV